MANVQHLHDLGCVSKINIEQPSFGTVRAIVFGDDGSVIDIREFSTDAPISMITGLSDKAEGPKVVCTWGYIPGRAVKVNTLVGKAIAAMPVESK